MTNHEANHHDEQPPTEVEMQTAVDRVYHNNEVPTIDDLRSWEAQASRLQSDPAKDAAEQNLGYWFRGVANMANWQMDGDQRNRAEALALSVTYQDLKKHPALQDKLAQLDSVPDAEHEARIAQMSRTSVERLKLSADVEEELKRRKAVGQVATAGQAIAEQAPASDVRRDRRKWQLRGRKKRTDDTGMPESADVPTAPLPEVSLLVDVNVPAARAGSPYDETTGKMPVPAAEETAAMPQSKPDNRGQRRRATRPAGPAAPTPAAAAEQVEPTPVVVDSDPDAEEQKPAATNYHGQRRGRGGAQAAAAANEAATGGDAATASASAEQGSDVEKKNWHGQRRGRGGKQTAGEAAKATPDADPAKPETSKTPEVDDQSPDLYVFETIDIVPSVAKAMEQYRVRVETAVARGFEVQDAKQQARDIAWGVPVEQVADDTDYSEYEPKKDDDDSDDDGGQGAPARQDPAATGPVYTTMPDGQRPSPTRRAPDNDPQATPVKDSPTWNSYFEDDLFDDEDEDDDFYSPWARR